MNSIGFIGTGNMGRHMAGRLMDEGYELYGYDANPSAMEELSSRGMVVCESPKQVADNAEVVMASLPTPKVVMDVAFGDNGVIHGSRIKTLIDLSTSGTRTEKLVAEKLGKAGISVLDSPVSGGVKGAMKGTLAVMVSGNREAFESNEKLFEIIGKNVFYVGTEPGQGQAMKLANNVLSATALAATSEALAVAVSNGLDPAVAIQVLNAGTGRNSATVDKFPNQIITGEFNAGFKTSLMYKDLKLFREEAELASMPIWVTNSVIETWRYAIDHGIGDEDFTKIATIIEEWGGVSFRSRDQKR